MPEVALYCPQIPQNTGNIGRLCVGFDTKLHLIQPLGFSLEQKYVQRSALDYWSRLSFQVYGNFQEFYTINHNIRNRTIFALSSKAEQTLANTCLPKNSLLLYGSETQGLPLQVFSEGTIVAIRIPMKGSIRCFNLANSVAMGLWESFRQNGLMS